MKSTLYYCQILPKLEFSRQIFEKYSNLKFHENRSIGSLVVPWRQTDRRTDMMNLIVAFRNIANAPKNETHLLRVTKYFPVASDNGEVISE